MARKDLFVFYGKCNPHPHYYCSGLMLNSEFFNLFREMYYNDNIGAPSRYRAPVPREDRRRQTPWLGLP